MEYETLHGRIEARRTQALRVGVQGQWGFHARPRARRSPRRRWALGALLAAFLLS